jgi:hypothetical protein
MGQTGQNIYAAQAIAASVAQIELAVREVQPAVEHLGTLIETMSASLGDLNSARPRPAPADSVAMFPDDFERTMSRLQKQVNGSITQLQFYDRLVQHMAHLQDYLSGVAGQLAGGEISADDEQVWMTLRGRLRTRLISESQRALLDAVLPPPEGPEFDTQQARDEHASQGTVELF